MNEQELSTLRQRALHAVSRAIKEAPVKHNLTFWKLGLLASALAIQCSYSFADTIVSVTDSAPPDSPFGFYELGSTLTYVVATSWTQSSSFSNVTIDALVGSSDPSYRSGTAYLMSAIGPGTTSAAEVTAPVDFTAPLFPGYPPPSSSTVLFSGLSLAPGTYYLVLTAPFRNYIGASPLDWRVPDEPVYTTAASATLGFAFESNTGLFPGNSFPPASTFLFQGYPQPMFSVITSVPEPSSLFLLGTGLLGIVGARRRKLGPHSNAALT